MQNSDFESKLSVVIESAWGLHIESVTMLAGGMNSRTAIVVTPAEKFVAKWVPLAGRLGLQQGARTAALMTDRGIRAGAPVTSAAGDVTIEFSDGELALLEEVTGSPLSTSPEDQAAWGTARTAVTRVYTEYTQLPPVMWALLHTDPEPEAFLRDEQGEVGVIDWAGSVPGPALFDLASAVMYAGGEGRAQSLIAAYENAGAVSPLEIHTHLRTFGRLRAAVQADYFSRRLFEHDLTGIGSHDDNAKGLRDAEGMLASLGVRHAGRP